MPASRIAFAIVDLIEEMKRLSPRDAEIDADLRLDRATYTRVKQEVENHIGQQVVTHRVSPTEPGEWFKLAGLRVSVGKTSQG